MLIAQELYWMRYLLIHVIFRLMVKKCVKLILFLWHVRKDPVTDCTKALQSAQMHSEAAPTQETPIQTCRRRVKRRRQRRTDASTTPSLFSHLQKHCSAIGIDHTPTVWSIWRVKMIPFPSNVAMILLYIVVLQTCVCPRVLSVPRTVQRTHSRPSAQTYTGESHRYTYSLILLLVNYTLAIINTGLGDRSISCFVIQLIRGKWILYGLFLIVSTA